MKSLVLQVIDAIRRRIAGSSPPAGPPVGRVAHLQHAEHDAPNVVPFPRTRR